MLYGYLSIDQSGWASRRNTVRRRTAQQQNRGPVPGVMPAKGGVPRLFPFDEPISKLLAHRQSENNATQ
jgi:hypothetical protein